MSLDELKCWEECGLMIIDGIYVDILSLPKVQGVRLLSLFRGSLIRVLSFDSETEGWAKVELFNGRVGYMRNQFLRKRNFPSQVCGRGSFRKRRLWMKHHSVSRW